MLSQAAERITTGVAATGVTSPFWLPSLNSVDAVLGILFTTLGCVWLAVQIVFKLRDQWRGRQ